MNNTCSLALILLATFAGSLPTASAQMVVHYAQPLSSFPVVTQLGNPVVGTPLTFSQANAYSQPLTFSQANVYSPSAYSQPDTYSQPLTFEQANTYSPGMYSQPNVYSPAITYLQPSTYSQPNITLVGGQSSEVYSSIPAGPAEIATPQLPVYSAPSQPPSAVQPQATVACKT